jgi:capsular exopolysaccharide synthesis family protein
MSRIHSAMRRAAEPELDAAAEPSDLAREIATMVSPWDNGPRDAPEADLDPPPPIAAAAAAAGPAPAAPPAPAPAADEASAANRFTAPAEFGDKLVVASNAKLFCVEQYRKLCASLLQAQAERGLRVILVTSALPAEGKTLTAVNLALTFSESYRRRVLLIDADLRHPAVHKVFQAPNHEGLSETLRSPIERPIPLVRLSAELSLLSAGAADQDPMRGLTSERMKRVIAFAAERFEWVIVDTPPVAVLPDAKLLTSMADGVLVVVRAGGTPLAVVQKAIDAVGRDRIVGVVLNRVDERVISEARFGDYYSEA